MSLTVAQNKPLCTGDFLLIEGGRGAGFLPAGSGFQPGSVPCSRETRAMQNASSVRGREISLSWLRLLQPPTPEEMGK